LWPWGNAEDVLREKVSRVRREQNFEMRRGNRLEPVARELFSHQTGIPVKPVCVESTLDGYDWLRASLDGWRSKGPVILEIKAPNICDHEWAIEKLVPLKYRPQLVHQCLVTGADEVFYASYSEKEGVKPEDQLAIVLYRPTADELGELLEAEELFWLRVKQARGMR
jgi:putative phage-type endonuclease